MFGELSVALNILHATIFAAAEFALTAVAAAAEFAATEFAVTAVIYFVDS